MTEQEKKRYIFSVFIWYIKVLPKQSTEFRNHGKMRNIERFDYNFWKVISHTVTKLNFKFYEMWYSQDGWVGRPWTYLLPLTHQNYNFQSNYLWERLKTTTRDFPHLKTWRRNEMDRRGGGTAQQDSQPRLVTHKWEGCHDCRGPPHGVRRQSPTAASPS